MSLESFEFMAGIMADVAVSRNASELARGCKIEWYFLVMSLSRLKSS